MLTFVLWIVVGVLAGIIARAVAPTPKTPKRPHPPLTVIAVLGAVIAGMASDFLRAGAAAFGVDSVSVIFAAFGAALVIVVARALDAHVER